MFSAQPHLIDQWAIVDSWRTGIVIRDRVENLCHDHNLTARDVELFQCLPDDHLRFAIRVGICSVLLKAISIVSAIPQYEN